MRKLALLLIVPLALIGWSILPSDAAVLPATGATYTLKVTKSGKCIDVPGASAANGALLQQWGCTDGAKWQQFKLVAAGSNYLLQNISSGKCIDVPAGSTSSGVQLQQWGCVASQTNQQFRLAASGTNTFQIINVNSGLCVSDKDASTASGAAIIQETCTANSNKQWAFTQVGAAASGAVGWGAGTTGGAGGSTTTVTTASALDSALQATDARIIKISGTIALTGMHRVASNKTIQGVGSSSGLSGGGLTLSGVSNVIIQNLNFTGSSDDAVNIQDGSHHVWVDHNTFSSAYDGLVDIRLASDYVTVSWNITRSHDKTMLLGSADDNTGDRGKLRVSYHHNWFDGTNQRHPRVRFGNPVHVYNNYYDGVTSYGVASTTEAGVLVEGNYFENVSRPTTLAQGTSPNGNLVQRNNHFVNSGTPATNGTVNAIPYSYTLDTASAVKSIVTAGAGTGKLGL
ncbi:pectate lyase [Actinoplanes lutulentus]|uniref:Pectate lyase n=1 Tax=Actinoplanes lutulentus TaxID=1287878 RepID=A0A327ZL98_9ACTN|nr:RICIN domain-containing protein [Actinoplanes lutulentus]MBB2940761.1 pectate lyase [Actinoplanes lutulentus]RAK43071.1 pectate lyase [Actinoplanes lutulentus]